MDDKGSDYMITTVCMNPSFDKTASIEIKDGSDKVADLTLVISTDSASTAKIYATAKTESKKVTIIGMYSIGSRTITGWDRTEDD